MTHNTLILSIRPHHACNIFKGIKTVELRRIPPKIGKDDIVLMYVTSPVQAIVGAFKIDKVVVKNPDELWEYIEDRSSLTRDEFDNYFKNTDRGVAIFIQKVMHFSEPIKLQKLREWWPGFHPPRVHFYLNGNKAKNYILHMLEEK